MITSMLQTPGGTLVKGAVLHGHAPRLLSTCIEVEAPLERNLIYLRNADVPGVMGESGHDPG